MHALQAAMQMHKHKFQEALTLEEKAAQLATNLVEAVMHYRL
jgi:hypothetical protein